MTSAGLRRALQRAREVRTRLAALDVLAALEAERHLDRRTLREASAFLAEHGLAPGDCGEWAPGIGETYGLFYQGPESVTAAILVRRTATAGLRTRGLGAGAEEQVRTALAAAWFWLNRHNKGAPNFLSEGHAVSWSGETVVDGGSLGLATAIAALSRYTGKPPDPTVAGSAELNAWGELRAVRGLEDKLRALRDCFPRVKTLVVARDQTVDDAAGLQVVRCATLEDATATFDIDIHEATLPPAPLQALLTELAKFEAVTYSTDPGGWETLYQKARAIAGDPRISGRNEAKALAWAALFATHAGRSGTAVKLLDDAPAEVLSLLGVRQVWLEIARATAQIDETPRAAIQSARRALAMADQLSGEERENLLGKATGTLGRALMHAGELKEAEPHLREAVSVHRASSLDGPEEARSRNYLATCLRLLGQVEEAIQQCELAREALERAADHGLALVTDRYVSHELGRSLLAAGKAGEAIGELHRHEHGDDAMHPWLGALRTLGLAHRALAKHAEADAFLRRCLTVAANTKLPPTIRKVAALAALEHRDQDQIGVPRSELEACIAEHLSDEQVRRSLRIY